MKHRRSRIAAVVSGSLLVGAAGIAAVACSSSSDQPQGASGGQGGASGASTLSHGGSSSGSAGKGSAGTGGSAGGSGMSMAANGGEAGSGEAGSGEAGSSGASASPPVLFTVPSGGGQVAVPLASGETVGFDFPASAAGLDVTLTPTSAQSIGWDDRFDAVIRMEPDGTTFADPIVITPSNKNVMVFDFPSSGTKTGAQGLALSSDGRGLLLNHFSTLVVVPAGVSCDSTSGWNASPNNAACSSFGSDSTLISFACKAYAYCLFVDAKCCAPAGSTACELGMSDLTLSYTPNDGNGMYPYCAPGAGGSGGAGQGGASQGGASQGGSSGGGQGGASQGGASQGGSSGGGRGGSSGGQGGSSGGGQGGSSGGGQGGSSGAGGASGTGGGSGMGGASGAGGAPDLTCGARTSESTPTGNGHCATPFLINITPGVLVTHYAAIGGNDWNASTSASTCVTSPTRTDVYRVLPPAGWTKLDITTSSPTSGEDPKISVLDADLCTGAEHLCANAGGADACELLSVHPADVSNNKIITVVVSSNSAGSTVQTTFLLH